MDSSFLGFLRLTLVQPPCRGEDEDNRLQPVSPCLEADVTISRTATIAFSVTVYLSFPHRLAWMKMVWQSDLNLDVLLGFFPKLPLPTQFYSQ
jgi:hypothetical protein